MRRRGFLAGLSATLTSAAYGQNWRLRIHSPSGLPVLQATSITIGALTQVGYGQVQLSAESLGLLAPGSPVPTSWTVTYNSGGGSAYWTLPAGGVAEGANAVTPTPTSAGVTANLGGGGAVHTFAVTATNAFGVSNTVILTVNIVAGAASLGNQVINNTAAFLYKTGTSAARVAAFQAAGGTTIIFTPGTDLSEITTRYILQNLLFSSQVTLQNADGTRPAKLNNLQINTVSNLKVEGLLFTGAVPSAALGIVYLIACTSVVIDSCTFSFGPTTCGGSNMSAIKFDGTGSATNSALGCMASNNTMFGIGQGLVEGAYTVNYNLTWANNTIRQFYNNALFLSNAVGISITDTLVCAPLRIDSNHMDSCQISNGSSPSGVIQRFEAYMTEGNCTCQGPMFSGTAALFYGYVAGNTLTITGPYTYPADDQTVVNISKGMLLASGSAMTPAHATAVSSSTTTAGTTITLDGPPQTVGSASEPVTISTAPMNMQISDVLCAVSAISGMTVFGGDNFSLTKSTYVLHRPVNNYARTTVTATVSGTTMDILSIQSGYGLSPNQTIAGTGIPTGDYIVGKISAPTIQPSGDAVFYGAGTFSIKYAATISIPETLAISEDVPVTVGPELALYNQDIAQMHLGANVLSGCYFGFKEYVVQATNTPTTTPPPNWTIGNVGLSNNSLSQLATDFAGGAGTDPQSYLEGIPAAAWAAMSIAQIRSTYRAALTPKSGGQLDAGGGNAYGALTFSGAWN